MLVRADLTERTPLFVGSDPSEGATADVVAGVVHIAAPFDDRIRLRTGDVEIEPRPAFGVTTAFDIAEPATATLGYREPTSRALWLALQAALWLAVFIVASRARSPFGRRRGELLSDETLIDLDELPPPAVSSRIAGEVLGSGMAWRPDEEPESVDPDVGRARRVRHRASPADRHGGRRRRARPVTRRVDGALVTRRVPALVLTVVAFAAIVITSRVTPTTVAPVFASVRAEWMPVAPPAGGLTQTWFCPGVPATGEEGVGGELVVANAGSTQISAIVTLLNDEQATVIQDLTVAPHDRTVLDLDAQLSGQIVSAVVEVDGGGAVVEQRAFDPAGTAVSPCANSTSATWYLADGFTVGESRNQIVLTNPYDDAVIVDVGFATVDGSRTPSRYQGFPIDGHSVKVIDLGVAGEGAQGEEVLAVKVESTRGQLIVGRLQHFTSGGRLGFTMSLGAPALRDQWWFAGGEKGSGIDERYSLFNPTGDDVSVDVVFLGAPSDALDPIVVPARQVVTFDPGEVTGLGEGRHAAVFSTLAEPSIVVERALTKIVDRQPSTSVVLGAVARTGRRLRGDGVDDGDRPERADRGRARRLQRRQRGEHGQCRGRRCRRPGRDPRAWRRSRWHRPG